MIKISVDDGLVSFNKTITNPWSSLTCIDDSPKHKRISIHNFENNAGYLHTY